MIREERNALFLLLFFTAAGGLFYLLVLRPVLSDVTAAGQQSTEASTATDQLPDDLRPKSARRMVSLKAWLRDAVSGMPLQNARVRVLDIDDIANPTLSLSPEGQLLVDFLPASISFGLLLECDGYQPKRFTRLRNKARAVKNAEATTRTDPEGAYQFENLPPGLYAAYSLRHSFGSVVVPDLDLRYGNRRLQIDLASARPIQGELLRPLGVDSITNGRLVAVEAADPLAAQLSAAIIKVDQQGQFALVGVSAAPHFLFPVGDELTAAGHGPRILSIPGAASIPAAAGLELEGTLRDSDHLPVVGALIQARSSSPGALLRLAASGEDGRFRLRGLPRGTASLLVQKDGLAPNRTTVSVADLRQTLEPITLLPPALLTGRVVTADQPLVGAVVRCSAHEIKTLTDSMGRYLLEGLPPGGLVISAEAAGYARRESMLEVRLRGENQLDFDLQLGGSLRVVIKGPGDVPVPQARLLALELGDDQTFRAPPIQTLTDSGGMGRILGLPADGKFVLMAHAPGYAPMRSQQFELTDRLRRSGVALTLRPGGSIDGICRDPEGRPIPGVRIRTLRTEASELDRALLSLAAPVGWSGPDGSFSLSDLPAGAFRLWAGRPGHLTSISATARIQESTLLTHFDLELRPTLDVGGLVLDAAGQPVAHARVSLRVQDEGHPLAGSPVTTLTDASGAFHLLRPDADTLLLAAELENRGQAEKVLDRQARPPFDLVLETP